MENIQKPFVIAIAAVSGGGKTTITTCLNDKLMNTKALYFDNYEFDDEPDDICEWVENGADLNEWNLAPLINDLRFLLSDHNPSPDYILLDYPFAYSHNEMSKFINFTIFIDTPLDIAMARRILRDFTEEPIENVRNDVKNYLSRGRFAYLEMLRTTKPNSDFIVDGSLTLDEIVDVITMEIKKRIG
jgi:uridine kinase